MRPEKRGLLAPRLRGALRFTDGFESVFGTHAGFRRNNAKGLSASGRFVSDGAREAFSRTSALDRLVASKTVLSTGKPDEEELKAYLAQPPETTAALKIVHSSPPTSGFENSTFHGLNAFGFTSASRASTPVRWMLVPEQEVDAAAPPETPGENYLFDALIHACAKEPLRWRLVLTIGEPQDPTHDATKQWPTDRRRLDVGTLTLDSVNTEEEGNARDISFDPLVLPDGIAALDAPLLSARSSVYARSFARRSGELKHLSCVDVKEVQDES